MEITCQRAWLLIIRQELSFWGLFIHFQLSELKNENTLSPQNWQTFCLFFFLQVLQTLPSQRKE